MIVSFFPSFSHLEFFVMEIFLFLIFLYFSIDLALNEIIYILVERSIYL
ncbi:hypothetical protein ACJIZ3_015608 [Penstemon smallii]|uniref:Uncharacterized protein n=1 Tax=Penstemon smallii TaxID=265156 RepID=A0ABD3RMZ4_9LAMI